MLAVRICGSPARKERVDPDHRPPSAHAERDAIDPHVFIGIVDEVITHSTVPRRQRQGRQQVTISQRALRDVVSVLARTRRDGARLICVPHITARRRRARASGRDAVQNFGGGHHTTSAPLITFPRSPSRSQSSGGRLGSMKSEESSCVNRGSDQKAPFAAIRLSGERLERLPAEAVGARLRDALRDAACRRGLVNCWSSAASAARPCLRCLPRRREIVYTKPSNAALTPASRRRSMVSPGRGMRSCSVNGCSMENASAWCERSETWSAMCASWCASCSS